MCGLRWLSRSESQYRFTCETEKRVEVSVPVDTQPGPDQGRPDTMEDLVKARHQRFRHHFGVTAVRPPNRTDRIAKNTAHGIHQFAAVGAA